MKKEDDHDYEVEIKEALEEALDRYEGFDGVMVAGFVEGGLLVRTAGMSRIQFAYLVTELQRVYNREYDEDKMQ